MESNLRDSLKRTIRRDQRVKRLKQAFDDLPQYRLPFDDLKKEMRLLHSQRKLHRLSPDSPNFIHELSEAALIDHGFRSRITEILVAGLEAKSNLAKTLKALTEYLIQEYATSMVKLRTKDERKQFIDSILNKFHSYLSNVEVLVDICRTYIDNIDKGGYTIRELNAAYQTLRKFEEH